MSGLPETLGQPPEAVIQFSDVFGFLPTSNPGTTKRTSTDLIDFDAILSAQVGNTGRFRDGEFPIGSWPALGDYATVLLWQLRESQIQERSAKPIVAVVNCAPRTSGHFEAGTNGDEFYVATTDNGIEIYSPVANLRGLAARGLIKTLHRIPNDSGLWAEGEQFRSSTVVQARNHSSILEPAELSDIPKITQDTRVAYADKFGNVRLEVADRRAVGKILDSGVNSVRLKIGAYGELVVRVVGKLSEIPEDKIGIYRNPSEIDGTIEGPGYIELVRRVSSPNTATNHAHETLLKGVPGGHRKDFPARWEQTNITIEPK